MSSSSYPKRLIEVDLPIKRISAHARREKSIRHGHISTLHIWWARRPLAACRAVICAALWPDPADPICPPAFRKAAVRIIADFAGKAASDKKLAEGCDPEAWKKWCAISKSGHSLGTGKDAERKALREALLDFIADFANWDNSTVKEYLDTSRAITQSAHESLGGTPGTRPLVVDPFAGGGSIPLEALRVGADAFASDLNPVPVLLNKVVLEYVPKYGQQLVDDVRKYGELIGATLKRELADSYPTIDGGGIVNSSIWARTVLSDAPGGGEVPIEIPLVRSMLLLNKRGRYVALRWIRNERGQVMTKTVSVTYANGKTLKVRQPQLEIFHPRTSSEVEEGTSSGGAATCPVTGHTTSVERVREQLAERRGGAADARLICVVFSNSDQQGKAYRLARREDIECFDHAKKQLERVIARHRGSESPVPDGHINHLRGFFNVVLYGMTTWGDLFSPRQALGLVTLTESIREVGVGEMKPGLREAVQTCLAMALDRCADKCASLVVWDNTRDMATHVFGRQALPMIWDFAEVNLLSDNGWHGAVEWVARVLQSTTDAKLPLGTSVAASATDHPLPSDSVDAVVTDPPYYAAIPYADLSDFFYSWLKRSVGHVHSELFKKKLSPKAQECVSLAHRAAMYREKNAAWFEGTMTRACEESRRIAKPGSIAVVVFANKETAGWEAMLNSLIAAGWTITGSWPIDTEMGNRLRARNSATLSSSVHLVCRPRENPDGSVRTDEIGDWRDVLAELPNRIHEWMPRLAEEGVVGADAIFACLGPALEVFSRYSRVEKASGEAVTLKEYLEQVWAAVAKEALAMIFRGADATGFEEDARLTAMWLWTLKSGDNDKASGISEGPESGIDPSEEGGGKKKPTTGFVLEFDAARKIAQGLGAHLDDLKSLVEVHGETARLLPVADRARFLFGKTEGKAAPAKKQRVAQMDLFKTLQEVEQVEHGFGDARVDKVGATVLDRVHQSMILFAVGRGEALKRFLVDAGAGGDSRFWRLAQALSALYPTATEEKRWVDGVLARKKGFGF